MRITRISGLRSKRPSRPPRDRYMESLAAESMRRHMRRCVRQRRRQAEQRQQGHAEVPGARPASDPAPSPAVVSTPGDDSVKSIIERNTFKFVYMIRRYKVDGERVRKTDLVKIGFSYNPLDRVRQLKTGWPMEEGRIEGLIKCPKPDGAKLEKLIHSELREEGLSSSRGREWFHLSPRFLRKCIKRWAAMLPGSNKFWTRSDMMSGQK